MTPSLSFSCKTSGQFLVLRFVAIVPRKWQKFARGSFLSLIGVSGLISWLTIFNKFNTF